ncbi:MAG: hypothetical protein H7288_25300 [Kineosporiaceae bacterium]|nr:hypothetical protein [Aeromicrobium sp.]
MTATLHVTPEITEFARKVREQLADLPAEDIDDLTDGLEADMAEAFAEVTSYELPDVTVYAIELRNAAGLPMREASAKGGFGHAVRGMAESLRLKGSSLRKNPASAGFFDFLISLRPVWWTLRAIIAYLFVVWMTSDSRVMAPHTFLQWTVMAALFVVSVQWGRGLWRMRWLKWPLIIGNVFAAIVLVPVLTHQADQALTWQEAKLTFGFNPGGPAFAVDEPQAGVKLNDKEVTNIFAYGADGKPVKNVQLFDQDGRPLATSVPGGNGCLEDTPCVDGNGQAGQGVWIPSILETGAKVWNVYPIQMHGATYDGATGQLALDPTLKPENRTFPFIKVPAVLQPEKVVKGNG